MQERGDNQTIRAHLLISGRVQGVFYRTSTQDKARSLGLSGWVCNLPDGRVEIIVQGRPEDVQELIVWAHSGPPLAIVDEVDVTWEEPLAGEIGFRVR
ncbi:MAG TPA: acylphosphatase [Candidatus Acetothermia bacterium]|nr:acylphosphatase [Candidatus Acetothermia bacterium]